MLYFRWIFNAIFFATPMALYILFSMVWNIFLNIHFNRWWAGGNLYLMVNTLFNLVQGANAIWLVYEIPVYLDWFKLNRVFSFEAAIFYNALYAFLAWKTYQSVFQYDYVTRGPPDSFEVFKDMFLVYNLILHVWILPINFVTIAKEIELEYVNLFTDWATTDRNQDDASLGEEDALNLLNLFNPFTWVDWFWWFWFGYSFYDLF